MERMTQLPDTYARDLDLNLLRVFAVVAEEGSITRAASRLYVTQPAVSAAMRRLSAYVGTELFTRQGRGIVLTSRGTELLAAARAHLEPLLSAAQAAPVFDPQVSTATVRLGLADAMEGVLLPALLARLRTDAPRMQLIVLPVQFRTVEASSSPAPSTSPSAWPTVCHAPSSASRSSRLTRTPPEASSASTTPASPSSPPRSRSASTSPASTSSSPTWATCAASSRTRWASHAGCASPYRRSASWAASSTAHRCWRPFQR
jgi:hypothetical protein